MPPHEKSAHVAGTTCTEALHSDNTVKNVITVPWTLDRYQEAAHPQATTEHTDLIAPTRYRPRKPTSRFPAGSQRCRDVKADTRGSMLHLRKAFALPLLCLSANPTGCTYAVSLYILYRRVLRRIAYLLHRGKNERLPIVRPVDPIH